MSSRDRDAGLSIFISYRRATSRADAGRLYDALSRRFGRASLFMDVDNVRPGHDWVETIDAAVSKSDAVLVLIGKNWADVRDEHGRRRLDIPTDPVRLEIEAAIQHRKLLVPILFDQAELPDEGELPASVLPLRRRQIHRISHGSFQKDLAPLVRELRSIRAGKSRATAVAPPLAVPSPALGPPKEDSQSRLRRPLGVIASGVAVLTIASIGYALVSTNLTAAPSSSATSTGLPVADVTERPSDIRHITPSPSAQLIATPTPRQTATPPPSPTALPSDDATELVVPTDPPFPGQIEPIPLDPGTYRFGRFELPFTFRVEEPGWTVRGDTSDYSWLGYESEIGYSGEVNFIDARVVLEDYCPGGPSSLLGSGPDDLVRWLLEQPYIEPSEPAPVTIGGRPGVRVDFTVTEFSEDPCPNIMVDGPERVMYAAQMAAGEVRPNCFEGTVRCYFFAVPETSTQGVIDVDLPSGRLSIVAQIYRDAEYADEFLDDVDAFLQNLAFPS